MSEKRSSRGPAAGGTLGGAVALLMTLVQALLRQELQRLYTRSTFGYRVTALVA